MSDTFVSPSTALAAQADSWNKGKRAHWRRFWLSPLWVCFLIAVVARVWLIVHTHGVMDGDEATVGIQAEHILRGEFPVYYYGQAYLGNIQAYVIAFIFLFTGPRVWAMRIEPVLTSLLIVYLTWHFASVLARAARLGKRASAFFILVATLVAAFAPLYDVVEEMRVTGGYIESFAVMLWLLLCAFRLVERWQQQARRGELAWRWVGTGFLVGLGLWIDPLTVYAYAACALWIGGYVLGELIRRGRPEIRQTRLELGKEALLSLWGVPAALTGFTPGLIWGAQNGWANLRYIFQNSGGASTGNRLHTILKVQEVYVTCLAPRALGGALPTQPDVTPAHPRILTFGLVVVGASLLVCGVSCLLSLVAPQDIFARLRRLTLLPLLFFLCASAIFCLASISTGAIYSGCGPVDYVGRYVVALVLCLPFFVAAAFSIPLMLMEERASAFVGADNNRVPGKAEASSAGRPASSRLWWMQGLWLVILVVYFATQGMAYIQADPTYTFHPTGCVAENPTDVTPLIEYMQSHHIHYAWASSWIGNRITFQTNAALIVTDLPGRVPANSQLVLRQARPGIFMLARHADTHPAFLRLLDSTGVTYQVARFFAEPGIDVLFVLPLNRTVSPLDPAYKLALKKILIGCL
jgi:hypothetical protein